MKKRFFMSVALALVCVMLLAPMALAAKPAPFTAGGVITSISPGTVAPAGQSDRWRVIEREMQGFLSGDISGPFTLTYKANIESVATQAGNFHGRLVAGDYLLNVNGSIDPLVWLGPPFASPAQLTLSGHWTFLDGAKGQGDFEGMAIFIPTPEGHVGTILFSSFSMSGQWQP